MIIEKLIDLYRIRRYPVLQAIRSLRDRPVIYTVGARDGLPSTRLQYLHRHNAIVSVGFEPDPEEAARLTQSGLLDHVSSTALGNESKTATLYLTKMRGGSSLYRPDLELLKKLSKIGGEFEVEREVQVRLSRLDEVIPTENLPLPNLLHIDAQASEPDILEGAGVFLDGISVITLEAQTYPVYQSQKLFHEITAMLWEKGFACCQIDNPNKSPVFTPYFVEANVSYVNLKLLEEGHDLTYMLMKLARLGERSQSHFKAWASKRLRTFGLNS